MEAAEESVGRGRKRQPDSFSDANDTLMPLVTAKRRAYHRFLQTHATSDKREFRRTQRVVKKAVDEAKEAWIGRVVKEAECVRRDGKQRWKSIRMLQMTHVARRPARPTRLIRRDGGMTNGPREVRAAWYKHFSSVLNIPSQYRQEVLDVLPSLPPALEVDHLPPPTLEELMEALRKMRRGKAGGRTGILPELLLYGGAELQDRPLQLMTDIWEKGRVVKDWQDAEIVPIPKKGDLRRCDNWRGISLLDVCGKVFARILQDRLQVVTEVLPESQCGFMRASGEEQRT